MKHSIIIILFLSASTTAKAQLWEQVGGPEWWGAGAMYSDTLTNSLYIGGIFLWPGDTVRGIFRYDGNEWETVAAFDKYSSFDWRGALTRYQGKIIYGGYFRLFDDVFPTNIAAWNGTGWEPMGATSEGLLWGPVHAFYDWQGSLVVGGQVIYVDSVRVDGIARWDGSEWDPLGTDMFLDAFNREVTAIEEYHGELYMGGRITMSVPGPFSPHSYGLAKWDGEKWKPVGYGGLGPWSPICGISSVNALATFQGELYIGGCFPLLPVYEPGTNFPIATALVKWNGTEYRALGAEEPYVIDMVVFNEELYVVGEFDSHSEVGETNVFKWDGSRWCSLGSIFNGPIHHIGIHNGELYVSGGFTHINGEPFRGVVKWVGGDYTAACGTPVATDEPLPKRDGFVISPNPAGEKISLSFSNPIFQKNTNLKVFDTLGHIVFKKNNLKNIDGYIIEVSSWPPGVYFMNMEVDGQAWTKKIIIQ
ncbi:MAG TPA: T9SS type A sorting domain-containing protein [Bacteroidetes bacterium]|nr:T9SS type A sorting domain-containing protein [Bacteroidota bacterium]